MKNPVLYVLVICLSIVCVQTTSPAATKAEAEVYTHKAGETYHSTGLVEHPTYAAAGVTEDPDTGDPIDPPQDWTHDYGALDYGDIAGMAQAWAETDALKAYLHLYMNKTTTERVRFYAWTNSTYAKTVQFENPNEQNFFTAGSGAGLDHTVELDFRVTGNIQENDISGSGIRSDVNLQIYNENANPDDEGEGWWPLINDNWAGDNDVDANGDYDKTATYPYSWIDDRGQHEDYNGEPIPFELLLWLQASEANNDAMGEGDVIMDFTSTCVLKSVRLYEHDPQGDPTLLVAFDGQGTPTGGSQQDQWILVPEPGSLVLIGLGGLALLRRRR